MSSLLQITQAKPNPLGKDKTPGGTPKPEQLLGEWVDIKNIGTDSVRFSSVHLHHTLFTDTCGNTGRTEGYWSGASDKTLDAGQLVRIHTGRARDEALMKPEDKGTVNWRAFAERDNFVLNNKCGDTVYVTWNSQDSASYDPNPPEGRVLKRAGNKLI